MNLEQLVAKARGYGSHGDASRWRKCNRPCEIARQAWLEPWQAELLSPDATRVAEVLGSVGSDTLTHGRERYRASLPGECREPSSRLETDGGFHANSQFDDWFDADAESRASGFAPLTCFDIETGLSDLLRMIAVALYSGEPKPPDQLGRSGPLTC